MMRVQSTTQPQFGRLKVTGPGSLNIYEAPIVDFRVPTALADALKINHHQDAEILGSDTSGYTNDYLQIETRRGKLQSAFKNLLQVLGFTVEVQKSPRKTKNEES